MQTLIGTQPGNLGKLFRKEPDGKWYWIKMGKAFGNGYNDQQIRSDLDKGFLEIKSKK